MVKDQEVGEGVKQLLGVNINQVVQNDKKRKEFSTNEAEGIGYLVVDEGFGSCLEGGVKSKSEEGFEQDLISIQKFELKEVPPGIYQLNLTTGDLTEHERVDDMVNELSMYYRPILDIYPRDEQQRSLKEYVEQGLQILFNAVKIRCQTINTCHPYRAKNADNKLMRIQLCGAPIMILFSGGVDSTLIAALSHLSLASHLPIDLVNVCFDGGRSPDRLSALDAYQELQQFAPTRNFRLILVNSSLDEVDELRDHLVPILRPSDTVMDFNIGAALWLAARGQGYVFKGQESMQDVQETYLSQACVVLLGHGADEQCGGYGRHKTRFREGGWEGLHQELAKDVQNLWIRNLGRDDRLIADHGREARHPFLDEDFMQFVLNVPLQFVCDATQGIGAGDKLILREMLRMLGLPRAASRVKRAIQFGTRIGTLFNKRDFGSNRAANLKSAGQVRLQDVGRS